MSKKVIVFDWGRTLHDPDVDELSPGVLELLAELSKRYTLAVITLPSLETTEERRAKIARFGISTYVPHIFIAQGDKGPVFERLLKDLAVTPEEIVVVDDRTVRGIAWGNSRGAHTIWLRKGKFANELPTVETGQPNQTIGDISELLELL